MDITSIFKSAGVGCLGIIPLADCRVFNQRLYDECLKDGMTTVIVFAVPYRTGKTPIDNYNMSQYARTYDYHRYFDMLFAKLKETLASAYPDNRFESFADHSPIDEKAAAVSAGIGVYGENTLLITKDYGSYVYLGSVLTDMALKSTKSDFTTCIGCGKCVAACPNGALKNGHMDYERCMSYISQKKVKTEEDTALIAKHGNVWGCDICQEVCPLNEGKLLSDIAYFRDSYIEELSYEWLEGLSDEEFSRYPFSWRKRRVILDNLKIIDKRP